MEVFIYEVANLWCRVGRHPCSGRDSGVWSSVRRHVTLLNYLLPICTYYVYFFLFWVKTVLLKSYMERLGWTESAPVHAPYAPDFLYDVITIALTHFTYKFLQRIGTYFADTCAFRSPILSSCSCKLERAGFLFFYIRKLFTIYIQIYEIKLYITMI